MRAGSRVDAKQASPDPGHQPGVPAGSGLAGYWCSGRGPGAGRWGGGGMIVYPGCTELLLSEGLLNGGVTWGGG